MGNASLRCPIPGPVVDQVEPCNSAYKKCLSSRESDSYGRGLCIIVRRRTLGEARCHRVGLIEE